MDWYLAYSIIIFQQMIESRRKGIRMTMEDKVAIVLILAQTLTFVKDVQWSDEMIKNLEDSISKENVDRHFPILQ